MSFWDKLMGRGKKAAGDVADDPSLRREGVHQEAEGRPRIALHPRRTPRRKRARTQQSTALSATTSAVRPHL